jgi:hypothetical protein
MRVRVSTDLFEQDDHDGVVVLLDERRPAGRLRTGLPAIG